MSKKHLSHSNRLWLKIPGPSTYLDPSIPNIYIYIVPTCVVPWPMAYFRDLSKPQKSRFAHRDLNKWTQPAASTLTLNNSQSSLAAPANFSAFPWLPGEGMTRYDRMTVRCCDGFGTPKNPWGFSITKGLAQDGF